MVQVREMRVFLAAAETENFSEAARKLRMSQPAVSFQIQSLEKKLNVLLFERNGKRVALTEAGRELSPMAYELANLADNIATTFTARSGILAGNLQIGCGTNLAKYLLPHFIGAFHAHYPRVQVTCEEMSPQAVEQKLLAREIHLGLLSPPIKSKELHGHFFFSDNVILIAAAIHPWSGREAIQPSECRDTDWIVSKDDAVTNRTQYGLTRDDVRVAMEIADDEAILAAVETNQGVAFVSRLAAKRSLESGRVKMIRVEGLTPICREVSIVQHRARQSIIAQRFWEFIASDAGQSLIAQHLSTPQE